MLYTPMWGWLLVNGFSVLRKFWSLANRVCFCIRFIFRISLLILFTITGASGLCRRVFTLKANIVIIVV